MKERTYIACDLKSFYASVEAMERGLDPMTTNLVVADQSRTEKTICLAVSPSLKEYGISGRARLFEVVQRVKEVNAQRQRMAPGRTFTGSSYNAPALKKSPELAVDYVVAQPRMALYMKRNTEIYNIYLKYVPPDDIHVYSIDEVMIDVTDYLNLYHLTAREMVLTVGYDIDNLKNQSVSTAYRGEITMDRYGRSVPKHAHGTENLEEYTSSAKRIVTAVLALFDQIINKKLLVRRVYLTANHVMDEADAPAVDCGEQLDLFTDYAALQERKAAEGENKRLCWQLRKGLGKMQL